MEPYLLGLVREDKAMTMQGDALGVEYDPYAPGFDADPFPVFKELREKAPVYFWKTAGAWILTKFDDVIQALRDPRLSLDRRHWEYYQPNRFKPEHADYELLLDNGLWNVSRADHGRIRRLVSSVFSPRAATQMQELVQRVVDEMLDTIADQTICDIAQSFSEDIAMVVMCQLLRIPQDGIPTFRRFGQALLEGTSIWLQPEEFDRIIAPVAPGVALLRQLIAERRANPGDDLLSNLIRARDEGGKLSENELLALVNTLIAAGTETTGHVICYAVYNLLKHPEQLKLLRADWSLIGKAIEEVMRFDYFGKGGVPRYALEDLEIRGTRIKKGQMIIPVLTSAHRDPDIFPNADVFDITRDPFRNQTFGVGPHSCLGAPLGRAEAETAVCTLFQRFPDVKLVEPPTFGVHSYLRKIASLKVQLSSKNAV